MRIKYPILSLKRNKTAYLLGLDIRPGFIRLVELSYCNSKYRVEACANIELAESAVHDETIISAIKNILKQTSSKTKSVAIALSHEVVIFKEFQVAASLSPQEIDKFLYFNFTEDVDGSESRENLRFDYQTIDTTKITNDPIKLQSVAVCQERTEKWVKLLQAADLHLKVIDVDVYALERAIRWQLPNIRELSVVINLEYSHILIVALDSKKIVYMQEEAIDKKKLESINQIIELFDIKLRLICSTLSSPFHQIILGGARATLPGLIDAVRDKFNVSVLLANPFLGMESVSQLSPLMLISCGLALRVSNDNKN